MGGWRKMHNEELHNLYSLPNSPIIRLMKPWRMRLAVYIARIWIKNVFTTLVGKPYGKRPLGRYSWRIILK
jgi:hypothetical protein